MNNIKSKIVLKAMAMRMVRTTASTLLGIIGTVHLIDEVKWNAILPTVLISMCFSFLMCIVSLPETRSERVLRESNINTQSDKDNALESELGGETDER